MLKSSLVLFISHASAHNMYSVENAVHGFWGVFFTSSVTKHVTKCRYIGVVSELLRWSHLAFLPDAA